MEQESNKLKKGQIKVSINIKTIFTKRMGLIKYTFPIAMLAIILAILFSVPIVSAESNGQSWGPDRAIFTWAEPADYVTFNSITDNPDMGDERNFVRIKKANTEDALGDDVNLEVGQEYEVWVWFHNNAKAKLNGAEYNYSGMAQDAYMRMEQPELVNANTAAVIKGIIGAKNANPTEVWDEAFAHTDTTVLLRVVPNSAIIHSFGTINGQIISDDDLFSENGAWIGYSNNYWGTLPGCNEYSLIVL